MLGGEGENQGQRQVDLDFNGLKLCNLKSPYFMV
jgi:hypothetical protein